MAHKVIIHVQVDKSMKEALQKRADSDPEATISTVIRRCIRKELAEIKPIGPSENKC